MPQRFSADIIHEAEDRTWNNRFSQTNTPLVNNADQLGVAGEKHFCELLGVSYDVVRPDRRTANYQFIVNGRKVKVYTASQPGYGLLVKQGKVTADIYVLCYHKDNRTWVAGWTTQAAVLATPVVQAKRNAAYESLAHKVPIEMLCDDVRGLYLMLGTTTDPDTATFEIKAA